MDIVRFLEVFGSPNMGAKHYRSKIIVFLYHSPFSGAPTQSTQKGNKWTDWILKRKVD